jgi:VWFA-related protein
VAAHLPRACVLAAALLSSAVALAQQPPQAPDPIRVRIAMVPVDVRIVDRQGNPVTDLKQEDFTLLEDGVPQPIRHFSTQALAADPAARDTELLRRRAPGADVTAANRRVFLVMLGRGRHQAVVGGVDALSKFVRDRLLPQDRIAVMAWNRATVFTTDHALVGRTVARYGEAAEAIEADLKGWFSGLRAVYGSKTIPPQIQRRIDAVFAEAGTRRLRETASGQTPEAPRLPDEMRRTADDLLSRAPVVILPVDPDSGLPAGSSPEKTAALSVAFGGSSFDNFVSQATETFQDLGALFSGIEYLRQLDGEKHLVLFTERGLRLRSREDYFSLTNAASDARIALDTIHTGGMEGPTAPSVTITGTVNMPVLSSSAASFAEGIAAEDLRAMSEQTGGQATAFGYASTALDRIDRSTRFQYLLGYYPANATSDGKFRKLSVTVKRPGVTVLYRHGFYATEELVPLDRRQFVTSSRVYEAGRYARPIEDIKLTLKQPKVAERQVVLELHVDLSRATFTPVNDRHLAKLNLAVFFGDAKQALVGETWRTLDLNANEPNRDRLRREGTPVTVTIPLPPGARDVKVVVYDYDSDLLGTATARLR